MPIESFVKKREEINRTRVLPPVLHTPKEKMNRTGRFSVNMSARAPLMARDMEHFMNNTDMRMFVEAYKNAAQTPISSGTGAFF